MHEETTSMSSNSSVPGIAAASVAASTNGQQNNLEMENNSDIDQLDNSQDTTDVDLQVPFNSTPGNLTGYNQLSIENLFLLLYRQRCLLFFIFHIIIIYCYNIMHDHSWLA